PEIACPRLVKCDFLILPAVLTYQQDKVVGGLPPQWCATFGYALGRRLYLACFAPLPTLLSGGPFRLRCRSQITGITNLGPHLGDFGRRLGERQVGSELFDASQLQSAGVQLCRDIGSGALQLVVAVVLTVGILDDREARI